MSLSKMEFLLPARGMVVRTANFLGQENGQIETSYVAPTFLRP